MVIPLDTSVFWVHHRGKFNGNRVGILTLELSSFLMIALIFDISPEYLKT